VGAWSNLFDTSVLPISSGTSGERPAILNVQPPSLFIVPLLFLFLFLLSSFFLCSAYMRCHHGDHIVVILLLGVGWRF